MDANPPDDNIVRRLRRLTPDQRAIFLSQWTQAEIEALWYDWSQWARPNQLAPDGEWWGWLVMAGRGFGKNRLGSEFINDEARTGRASRIGLIARTASDVRDVMVEGESGILAVCHPQRRPTWEPTKRRLTWASGAMATTYSADEPDLLRGPQHDLLWGDEISTWRFSEAWSNALMGLRIGKARWLGTMTPKPTTLVRELIKDAAEHPDRIRLVTGSTYDNIANLSENYMLNVVRKYEGTRLGLQELYARLLEDNPDAIWKRSWIERHRVKEAPPLRVVAVALDPSASAKDTSSEAGIVCGGIAADGHAYILDDASKRGKPHEWAAAAVQMYRTWKADHMVAEVNHGGDMVVATILNADPMIAVRKVTASRGKAVRAEPISLLYEQGRVHHVGLFAELEDQCCTWSPTDPTSPDRMDALVWLLTDLMIHMKDKRYAKDYGIF